MSIAPGNENFVKILDSNLDSKVFEALVNAGILPQGFQVLVGTVDLGAQGQQAVLDAAGNSIQILGGKQVVYLASAESEAITGGSTLQFGLALTDGGAIVDALTAVGAANNGNLVSNASIYVDANEFLVVDITTADATAGEVQVVVVLV